MTDISKTPQGMIAALEARGAQSFDPFRWQYITSLLNRAEGKPDTVKKRIEQIALNAVDDYKKRFETDQLYAKKMIASTLPHPDLTDQLNRLFTEGKIGAIRLLVTRYRRRHDSGALSALTAYMTNGATRNEKRPATEGNNSCYPFDFFQNTWLKLYSDRLVARAIKDRPENAGPLNSQMLVTQSLSIMRRLSPDYLNRFVSYIDTLIQLARIDEENDIQPEKKRSRHK